MLWNWLLYKNRKDFTLGEKSQGSTPLQSNLTTVLNLPWSSSLYETTLSGIISEMKFFSQCLKKKHLRWSKPMLFSLEQSLHLTTRLAVPRPPLTSTDSLRVMYTHLSDSSLQLPHFTFQFKAISLSSCNTSQQRIPSNTNENPRLLHANWWHFPKWLWVSSRFSN